MLMRVQGNNFRCFLQQLSVDNYIEFNLFYRVASLNNRNVEKVKSNDNNSHYKVKFRSTYV